MTYGSIRINLNLGHMTFISVDMKAQSWHFVRKILKIRIIKTQFVFTSRLEISKNKRARSNFLFEFNRNGQIYKNQFKYWTRYSYFWRYGDPK